MGDEVAVISEEEWRNLSGAATGQELVLRHLLMLALRAMPDADRRSFCETLLGDSRISAHEDGFLRGNEAAAERHADILIKAGETVDAMVGRALIQL